MAQTYLADQAYFVAC